ncbi:MAG: serine/threonine-protein kinase [Anaerolineae bacterium]|jgi:outer membrane protein assembly factor BamB/tRNA A-37 threonylcarbamoyl transferase component Bud32
MTSADHLETRKIEGSWSASGRSTEEKQLSSEGLEAQRSAHLAQQPGGIRGHLPEDLLLQERYRILRVLAVGGMSAVYMAQDLRFSKVKRLCAVKEMINSAADPEVREMIVRNFERESSILATLNHPGIVQVYDCFTEGDRSYLVIEYVKGRDLEAVLADTKGFLPEAKVVSLAIQVCEVLSYLHSHEPRPIVFRDIKPSNIMLDEHEHIKLIDFGIAKMFQSGQKGTMIGTEGYSPPEQYQGIADPRVDIYALGATIHHLLSKRDPRLEPPFSFHRRPIHETNPGVSRELVDVVDRALEYNVSDRYSSVEEMQRALMGLRSARGAGSPTAFGAPAVGHSDISPLWRFACEDEIRSSPVAHDGVIYVGAYDHNLYAIDLENGEFLWKYPTDDGIASSPCIYKDTVFIGSADRVLYAIDVVSGRIRWTCPTEGRIWSSPRAAFDHVFFGSDDHHLYAVNVRGGRAAWKFRADGKVRSSPAIGDDAIYVGCEAGIVYAVDTAGDARWRFRARRSVTSSPAFTQKLIYIGGQDRYVYALDVRSGWLAWRHRTDGPVISSPAVSDGMIFIGSTDGHLYALDGENGRLIWRYSTDGQVTSSPAVFEGSVYVGSVDGGVYSLDAKTGDLRWRFQTGGPVASSPTATEGVIYIGSSDRYLYALPA